MNGLIFLLPFILVAGFGIYQNSFAQQLDSYRGETFLDVTNPDGSHTQTLGLSPFIVTGERDQFDRPVFTHYIKTEDANSVTVSNGEASFVFDKNTCTAQIYNGGVINGSAVIASDSYVPKSSVDGSGTWSIINSVNNASCVTQITETANSIEVSGTKSSAAGVFKIRYIKEVGLPLKTILEATNLTALTDRRFGVTQTQSIPQVITFGGQQRDLANHIGQTFDRTWLENNKANLLQFSNGLKFDVIDAWNNLESITVNSVSNGMASVSFNYLRNTPILLPNDTLVIDPTYSQTYTYRTAIEDNGNTDTCNAGTSKTANAYTHYIWATTTAFDCVRSVISWDISSIPDTSVVTDSDLTLDISSVSSPRNCDIRDYGTSDPSSDSASTGFNNVGSGTTLVNNNSYCTTAGNNVAVDLGSTADTNITAQLTTVDRYTLGFTADSETMDATTHNALIEFTTSPTPLPTLTVVYSIPCTNPLSPTAKTQNTTSILLNWVKPSPHCSATNYKVFQSKNGATYTLAETLGNVTSSYRNSLDTGTMYAYKISATTSVGGYGANSTIVTNSTLPIAPTSLVTTTNSQTRIDVSYSDGSQPNVLWFKSRYLPIGDSSWTNMSTNSSKSSPLYANFTSLKFGNTYSMQIASGTLGGFGAWSSNATGTTLPGVIYGTVAPSNLIIQDPHSPTKLNLDWDASAMQNINGYRVYREAPVGGGFSQIKANTTNTNTFYNDTGLTINTYYNYKVKSLNTTGESGYSNSYSGTSHHLPTAVDDLTATASDLLSIVLQWTQPDTLYGYLLGYNINYTTPEGTPTTVLVSNTNSSDVELEITGLDASAAYSFRVSAVTIHGKNVTGANIANATAFNSFEIGAINLPTGDNPNTAPILFEVHDIDDDTSDVQVFYDSSYDLACDFRYALGQANTTYSGLTENPISGTDVYSNFTVNGVGNDIIDIYCWDQLDNSTDGNEHLGQDIIPLVEQVQDFQGGIFGTDGKFGELDLMTLIIVIISMIGFNRYHPAVGVGLMVAMIGVTGYYGLIEPPTIIIGAIILIFALAIALSRSRGTD